ncbi:uncharacterized protein [Euphorbia lathyris]|uniref:uncharacterized protein n=1 Tax=Euphorbia lathyris TaxID=212925 RepID=UPI003313A80E
MARRRAKKTVKETASSSGHSADGNQPQIEEKEKQPSLIYQEVERQSSAIRAIRDMEIEHSLIRLRLLRSYLSEEKLQTPAIQFFRENLPSISVLKNCENGQFEVQWNDKEDNISISRAPDEKDVHASLLRRLSIAYHDCSANPSFGGFGFAGDTVRTSLLSVDDLQIRDFGLEGPSDSQMFIDGLHTPGANSQRMSVGMTPKTLRLPKPGEMLLSVHGSPLGVYKEDNMEAIHESEEG